MTHRVVSAIPLLLLPALLRAQAPFDAADSVALITARRSSLSLDPVSRVYDCRDTMTIAYGPAAAETASVRLHPAYTVVSFSVDGRETDVRAGGGRIRWARRRGAAAATVAVRFRGRIDFPSQFTRVSPEQAVLREEEILPWGPGLLGPGRLEVTVPAGWTVVAPGRRESAAAGVPTGGVTAAQRFAWHDTIPGIGWICAGRYSTTASPGGRAHLHTAAGDSTTDSIRSLAILRLADSLLEFYGATFAPYRFPGLSIVEVGDWVAGWNVLALAAPSVVLVKRTAFTTDDAFNTVETILPHEVAHQWWMGAVVARDRDAAFLSEGLCEYSSVLFAERSGRPGPRDTLSRSPLLRPLISRVRRGTAVPLDTALDIRSVLTQYLKGAYVHHMLRGVLGDDRHRELLSQFARRYEGRTATTADFRALAEELSGRPLGWFFDQWVAGAGLPAVRVYNVRSDRTDGGWHVTGRARIVGYERFTVDIGLELRTRGEPAAATVRLGLQEGGAYRNDAPFEFRTRHEPVEVAADPRGDLLLLRRLPEKLSDLRDPGRALMLLGTGARNAAYRRMAAADSARFVERGWDVAILPADSATLRNLQEERLILYGREEDHAVLRNLPRPFPIPVRGDTVIIDGEPIADPGLALIQSASSPWREEGLIVWVLPLSPDAAPELRPYDRSWVLLRGGEEISGNTWPAADSALVVPVPRTP